jgi:hypothetical protein
MADTDTTVLKVPDTKLGFVEILPITGIKIAEKVRLRTGLTQDALRRGGDLAKRAAPILHQETDFERQIIDTQQEHKHDAIIEALQARLAARKVELAKALEN